MLKSLGLLGACLLLFGTLSAQIPSSGNSFGFTLGYRQLTLRDQASSALTYRGNLPTLGLNWTRHTSQQIWEANLQGSYGKFFPQSAPSRMVIFLERNLDGSIDTVRVQATGSHLMLKGDVGFYHKQDFNHHSDAFWAVGARVSEELYYPQGFVSPGLTNVAAVSPQVLAGVGNFDKGLFTIGIVVPIAAVVTRLPYHQTVSKPEGPSATRSFFKYHTAVRTLNKHQEVKFRLGYQYQLGNHLSGGFFYEYAWLRDSDPRPLLMRTSTFAATLGFH
ncbi:MAG: hypothetical protein ACK4TA_05880 [Saprospiraceae bacterium]